MRRARGFTLLEIMLVLLLLGVASSLVMLSFPADKAQLARQGERLHAWLNDAVESAEREGMRYGMAFGHDGWRIVSGDERTMVKEHALPQDIVLQLSVEGQAFSLGEVLAERPQVWLYPGGETTLFSIALSQGQCRWQLYAPGYFMFETTDVRCDDAEI